MMANKDNNIIQGSSSHSRLFPQRTRTRSKSLLLHPMLMAASNDNSSDNNDRSPLLVKAWLSLRKLLARFWALLLKPFQLLKSLLIKQSKEVKDKDDVQAKKEDEAEDDAESIQEEVAITEVENIAVLEEDVEEDGEDIVMVAEEELVIEQLKEEEPEATTASSASAVSPPTTAEESTSTSVTTTSPETPTTTIKTPRAATTAAVSLTGNWTLIVDESFTSQYENYLRKLGQPMLVRTVAQTVIGSTKEETVQSDDGQKLFIRGMNVRGSWERTLEASEQISDNDEQEDGNGGKKHAVQGHELKPMTTADGEDVEVASWCTDENPYNSNLFNCLDYTDDPSTNIHPGEVNMAKLRDMYLTRRLTTIEEDGTVIERTELIRKP